MSGKTARLDLRLTDDQRAVINHASELAGTTVSGWAVSRLFSAARQEVVDSTVTAVPQAAWDDFLAVLGAPWDEPTTELMSRTPVWEAQ